MSGKKTKVNSIGFICTEAPPNIVGGMGRYAERIVSRFCRDEVNVHFVALNFPEVDKAYEQQGRLHLYRIKTPGWIRKLLMENNFKINIFKALVTALHYVGFNMKAFFKIAVINFREPLDVVAVHDWLACIAGIMCKLFLFKKVVFHVHSTEMSMNEILLKRTIFVRAVALLEKMMARLSHEVIVPSNHMKDLLIKYGWQPEKIKCIHHGFEDNEIASLRETAPDHISSELTAIRKSLGLTDNHKVIVFAGRYNIHKGIMVLINAMQHLVRDVPEARLLMIGTAANNGEENRLVKEEIEKLGLTDHIIPFYRFVKARELYYHFLLADVCVFPSFYEPFGLVAIEAMALEKPVVLGSGFADEIANVTGKNSSVNEALLKSAALKLSSNTKEELAAHIRLLLQEPDAAQALAKRAREHVMTAFSWEKAAASTLESYLCDRNVMSFGLVNTGEEKK